MPRREPGFFLVGGHRIVPVLIQPRPAKRNSSIVVDLGREEGKITLAREKHATGPVFIASVSRAVLVLFDPCFAHKNPDTPPPLGPPDVVPSCGKGKTCHLIAVGIHSAPALNYRQKTNRQPTNHRTNLISPQLSKKTNKKNRRYVSPTLFFFHKQVVPSHLAVNRIFLPPPAPTKPHPPWM